MMAVPQREREKESEMNDADKRVSPNRGTDRGISILL